MTNKGISNAWYNSRADLILPDGPFIIIFSFPAIAESVP